MRPTPYDNATQWRIAPWQPPAWVFGPVWTALYACIGLAGAVLYLQHGEGWAAASDTYWQLAIAFWFVQLLFNGLWTPAYFYWYEPRGALALLVLALGAALTSTVCMFLVGRAAVAGALMLPYLVWLLYALTLNAYVVAANDMDALVRRREAYWSPAPAEKKRQMMMLRL
jgi:tryptophan-rich sensory protein